MPLNKNTRILAFVATSMGLLAHCSGKAPSEKATNAVIASMYAQKGDAIQGKNFDVPQNKGNSAYQIEVEGVFHNTERNQKSTVIRYIIVGKDYPTWAPRCGELHQYKL